METAIAAFWGFLGAFMYAGPNLMACLYQCGKAGKHPGWCLADALVALAIGTIAAAALTAWGAEWLGADEPRKLYGVALIIGLFSNPLTPGLIRSGTKSILRRIDGNGAAE